MWMKTGCMWKSVEGKKCQTSVKKCENTCLMRNRTCRIITKLQIPKVKRVNYCCLWNVWWCSVVATPLALCVGSWSWEGAWPRSRGCGRHWHRRGQSTMVWTLLYSTVSVVQQIHVNGCCFVVYCRLSRSNYLFLLRLKGRISFLFIIFLSISRFGCCCR